MTASLDLSCTFCIFLYRPLRLYMDVNVCTHP